MAAQSGFEPLNAGVKVLCLASWLLGYINLLPFSFSPQKASFHQAVTRRIVDRHRYGCPQTPMGIWRIAEVPTPIRLLTVPTVFKTVLQAVAVNNP